MPKPKLTQKVLEALDASPNLKAQIHSQFLDVAYWIKEEDWDSALSRINELVTTIQKVNAIKQEKLKEIGFPFDR